MSARWASGECTMNLIWAHAELKLMSTYERWKVSERERKVKDKRTVTIWERKVKWFILSSLGIILTLCFVGNRGKITNTQNVCIVISLNMILSDWRISERWTHVERFVNNKVELNEAYSPNEHTKKARNKKVKRFRDCTIQCLNNMYNGGFSYWKKYIYKKAWIF